MVAHALRKNSEVRGGRPFDPTRDLTGVARLLEEAFRPEHTFPLSNAPILREVGIALWTMSYAPVFPENVSGFVWIEEGHIVGNVTISQDEGRLDRYMISNVAVRPDYRRQGIARALMQMTVDLLRERGARWALLNVRPINSGAIQLYRGLGFQEVEMRGEWTVYPDTIVPGSHPPPEGIRRLRATDHRAVIELGRAALPANAHQFRSPRLAEFDPNWEDLFTEILSDFLVGQVTHRWVIERERKLLAVMMVQGHRLLTPHRIAVQVYPDYRGQFEDALADYALRDLARLPRREIRASVSSAQPEWTAALERRGFVYANGLTLMSLSL